ncbi:MAG TPA: hypothetical protein VGQ59_00600, partial [Cyclobacteriaceae bacterium]|nr:hypothetical protein [Cyclobacteriaceae bacterium]
IDNEIFDVHKHLAIYQSDLKNWKGAMAHLNKMRQLQPHSEVTWRLSGLIKAGLKDYYGAIIDLSHYLKYDTADIICWRNRAFVRYQIDDYKGSIEDYQKLAVLLPKDITIDIAIAENYSLMSEPSQAIVILKDALTKDVSNIAVKLVLADKLIDYNKVEEADQVLKEVNKYVARYFTFNFNSAYRDYIQCRIYFAEGKTEKAFKEVGKKITQYGETDALLWLRATIFLSKNELELAKRDLSKLKTKDYKPAKKMILKYSV